ncbi:MAG: HAMP domain-containing histidine kinase [Candidatus Omnitrophica bacterium]|nr:HAMP domain-containing histidine kinase [Candidatus Omnitrophota bacterium]
MDKKEEFDFNLEFIKLNQEMAVLKVKLANQEWASKKTNDGIKILYKELEKKNQELKKLDQLKSEFISMVSHELRTPLTTIRESVSQVLDGILGDTTEAQREFLSICLEDIDRLRRIIDNLLDISKIEAGKIKLKKASYDLVELARGLILTFTPRVSSKGLQLFLSAGSPKIQTFFDRDKIIQVFHNLIGNALKFTSSGFILITLNEKDSNIECSVSDSGPGISEDDLPKVFTRFQQFGRTPGPGEKGTGLGLAISKGIIQLHKGQIWVESPPVSPLEHEATSQKTNLDTKTNPGTAFVFTLPKYSYRQFFEESILEALNDSLKEEAAFALARFTFECGLKDSALHDNFIDNIQAKIKDNSPVKLSFIGKERNSVFLIFKSENEEGTAQVIKKIKSLLPDLMIKTDISQYPQDGFSPGELISNLDK